MFKSKWFSGYCLKEKKVWAENIDKYLYLYVLSEEIDPDGEHIPIIIQAYREDADKIFLNEKDAKRYYSQNAYLTEGTVTQENYYDIVTLIIDQLIYKGPVVAGIRIYQDFYDILRKYGYDTDIIFNHLYCFSRKGISTFL